MSSFFDKLKKGMDVEDITEDLLGEEAEEKKEEEEAPKKPKKAAKIKKEKKDTKAKRPKKLEIVEVLAKEPEKIEEIEMPEIVEEPEEETSDTDGELAIDAYQTENDFVIQSAIAGVGAKALDILVEDDMVMIRGRRQKPSPEKGEYLAEECFWGAFSRKIMLPEEVNPSLATAELKDGVLIIRIPKLQKGKKRKVKVHNT